MSARYFTLPGAYDMAAHLARAGVMVLAIDHPGVGDSAVPADPWTLTPDVVAAAGAAAAVELLDRLRAGALADGLPPLPALVPLGVGHSMGAMLVAVQQAHHRPYARLVLLGHSGRGLPEVLTPDELAVAGDRDAVRAAIVELARARFGTPVPGGMTDASEMLVGPDVPPDALAAIATCRSPLLAVCGLAAMIPGSHDTELAAVDVPVLIGLGDHDIAGEPDAAPAWLRSIPDVTLFVLRDAHHNHNIASTRALLWDRIARWTASLAADGDAASEHG
jgi:pimeloyl-ACP methyl ester carboxylesterase